MPVRFRHENRSAHRTACEDDRPPSNPHGLHEVRSQAFSGLLAAHELLTEKIAICWKAMDGYTEGRKESVLTLF